MPWEFENCVSISAVPFTTGGLTYDQLQGTYDDLQGTYNDLSPTVQSDVVMLGFGLGETTYADPNETHDSFAFGQAEFDSYVTSKIFTQPRNDAYWHECRVYYKALNTSNLKLNVSYNNRAFVTDTELDSIEPFDQEFIRTRKVRRGRTYQFQVFILPADGLFSNSGQVQLTGYEIDSSLAGESKR